MTWKGLFGAGKALTGRWSRLLWRKTQSVEIRPIGGKGTKRHLFVDGGRAPLSLVATGANRHDVTQLEPVLKGIIIDRPLDVQRHLCADKAYGCQPALEAILSNGYIPHVKTIGEEI